MATLTSKSSLPTKKSFRILVVRHLCKHQDSCCTAFRYANHQANNVSPSSLSFLPSTYSCTRIKKNTHIGIKDALRDSTCEIYYTLYETEPQHPTTHVFIFFSFTNTNILYLLGYHHLCIAKKKKILRKRTGR